MAVNLERLNVEVEVATLKFCNLHDKVHDFHAFDNSRLMTEFMTLNPKP